MRRGGLVKRTVKDDKTAVNKICKVFGKRRINKITKKDIERFYSSLPHSNASKYNIASTLIVRQLSCPVDDN